MVLGWQCPHPRDLTLVECEAALACAIHALEPAAVRHLTVEQYEVWAELPHGFQTALVAEVPG